MNKLTKFIPSNDSEKDYKFAWSRAHYIHEWCGSEIPELFEHIPEGLYFIGNGAAIYDTGDIQENILDPMISVPFIEVAIHKIELPPAFNEKGCRVNPKFIGSYVKKHPRLDIYYIGVYGSGCQPDFFASKEIIDLIEVKD